MKTLEQAKAYKFIAFGGSDRMALCEFLPLAEHEALGMEWSKDPAAPPFVQKVWTEEDIIAEMRSSVAFSFELASKKAAMSAIDSMDAIKFYLWALDVDVEAEFPTPESYGVLCLAFVKWVAVKYGFDNPIGDDTGYEEKYRRTTEELTSVLDGQVMATLSDLFAALVAGADAGPTPGCDCPACTAKLARMASEAKPTLH